MIMPFLALLIILLVFRLANQSNIQSTLDSNFIAQGSGYIDEHGNGFYHLIENEENSIN